MDVPPELKEIRKALAQAYIEEDAPHSIGTVDFGSFEKAVDEARGPGVKDRIKMFETVGNTEAYEQNLQSEKKCPNIGESDSMSRLQDYSIIESTSERENTDDMSITQSFKKKPPLAPKPVMKKHPPQSEDFLYEDEQPKREFKQDFSKSLFADHTQDSESSVAEEKLMNRDSSEHDFDMVCSNTELSSFPQELEILKADQMKADHPDEHVMTDGDEKSIVTETPNIELSTETFDIENADKHHPACQFENDLYDHDSSSEDNLTTKVEQSEKFLDGLNESRETTSGRLDADLSACLERGLDQMEGEPYTLSADTGQESVDYENVPQISDPNADNALHTSEIYEPASEHTIEDILPVRSHCAKDDEGNQLSVEYTYADEAEVSIQLVEAQTNQHIKTFRSMSSSVETADLGWSYIEPKTEDGNVPLSDCQTEELGESSCSISGISSSDDNITMKYEDAFVPMKDDDSSSQIPDQQPVSDAEVKNEDEPFVSTTEDERPPTPPPKSLVFMEELKSLAYSQESELMSGPYQQLGNDNMQSEEASQHPTDDTNSTYASSAFRSQPIPPIQGSSPNMSDFADHTQDSESSVAEEKLMNRDSSEHDFDIVCSNTELSSVPKELEILKADQMKKDHPDEHVMTDGDEKSIVTETPNVEISTQTLDIENADKHHPACQFENDLYDHDSSSEDNLTTKVEQSEKCLDGLNESRETTRGRLDADLSACLERGLDQMEGEPYTLSADTEQESVDYENVPQISDPNAGNSLHTSEIYEPASEHTIEDILPVRSHCAKDDEGNQLSVEDTDSDEAEDSIQLVEAQTNQHIETFRSMSSSVETADLGWSYIEPKTEDGNAPLSDCQTEELDESSCSISVISSSDDNITIKYEDDFVPMKDDDSSSQIPDQQPVSDAEVKNEDEPFVSTTEDERPPTPPPKSLVFMEELKSLAYSLESEPMSGPYQQLGNDNMQSAEASQHPTDDTNSTYTSSAFHSQPIPPIQGSSPNMSDQNLNRGPFLMEQQHGVPFNMSGFPSKSPLAGFPGFFPTGPQNQWPHQPPTSDHSYPGSFPPTQAPWPPFMLGMRQPIQGQFPGQSMPTQMYGGHPPPHFVPPGPVLPPFYPDQQFPTFGLHSPRAPATSKETSPTDANTQPFKTEQPQSKESPMSANIETPVSRVPRSQSKPQSKPKSPERPKSTGRDKPRNVHAESPAKDELTKQQNATPTHASPTHATPTHQRQTTAQLTKHSSSQKNVTKQSETKPKITERKPKESEKYERDTPKKEVKKEPKIPEKEVGQDTSTQYIFMNVLNPPMASCVSQTYMQDYLEICTDKDIDLKDIVFNYSRTCVVFSTKEKPDMERLKQKVKEKILSGTKFEVCLIDRPCSVAISSEVGLEINDSLEFFLESPRNHGGDLDLQQQMFETDDGSCIVATFKDPKVAEAFSQKRDHVLNNKPLVVSLFFRCDWGDVWDPDLHKVVLPEPIIIRLTNNTKRLLQMPACMTFILNLESKSCRCEFKDEGLKIMCTLNRTTTNIKTRKAKWHGEVAQFVENFMKHELEHYDLDCSAQIWEDMKTLCKKYEHEEKVAVCCNDKTKLIEMDSLKGFGQDVKDNLFGQAKALERQLRRTSECMQLKELDICLMSKLGTFESMKETDLDVNLGDDTVTMEGQPDNITTMQKNILETRNRIQHVNLNQCLSEHCLRVIKEKQALCDKLDEAFKKENIEAVWKVEGSSLKCAYLEDANYSSQYEYEDVETEATIRKIFTSSVTDKSINFLVTDASIVDSLEFNVFSKDLTEDNESLADWHIYEQHLKIIFFGWTPNVEKMVSDMKMFMDKNFTREVVIQPSDAEYNFIKKHKQDLIKQMDQTLEKENGSLRLLDSRFSFVVKGNERSRNETQKQLKKLISSIVSEKHKVDKIGVNRVYDDVQVHGKIAEIEAETKCIIMRVDEQMYFSPGTLQIKEDHYDTIPADGQTPGAVARSHSGKTETHQKLSLQNGTKIRIIEGEIGKQKGDIFVVSTSPNLELKSGKAGQAILKVAGEELQQEIHHKYKDIKFGEIADVSGSRMKCKKLYLTSLPGWDSKDPNPIEVLKKAVKTALELGSKQKKESILFSALGCGQLKYPVHKVAHEMMQEATDFDKANPTSTLKSVKFVVFHLDTNVKQAFKLELENRLRGDTGTMAATSLKKGSCTIDLVVEDIAAQQVDVIVCSTSRTMDLTKGACHALLKVGGDSLQEECRKKYSNSLNKGVIAEIKPGKLQCKALFFVVLPRYDGPKSIENLKKTIQMCINLSHTRGFKSLAIPALGTGNLHYPKREVAACLIDSLTELGTGDVEVPSFSVRVVMQSNDYDVIQEFKSFMAHAKTLGVRRERSYGTAKKLSRTQQVDTARLNYSSSQHEFHLHNTTLKVATGDILDQDGDAIIASVGKDFDINGKVADMLKRKFPDIETVCKARRQELQDTGVVIVPFVGLRAKHIMFLQYADSLHSWRQQIKTCLKMANQQNFRTISFPVLGSGLGSVRLKPESSASCLFEALESFIWSNITTSLREVRQIVFQGQSEMFQPIVDELKKQANVAAADAQQSGAIGLLKRGGPKFLRNVNETLLDDGTIGTRETIPRSIPINPAETMAFKEKEKQSSLEVVIYSDSVDNIQKCKTVLEKGLEDAMMTERIGDYQELIKGLKQEEVEGLDCVSLLVNFKVDQAAGIITIHGEPRQVHQAVTEIRGKLNKIIKEKNDKEQSKELAKKIKWQYEQEERRMIKYDEMLSFRIEMAYLNNKTSYQFSDNGQLCEIDFAELKEYPVSDKSDFVKVFRREMLKADNAALPEDWKPMKDDENVMLVQLQRTDPDFQRIEQRFLTELNNGKYAKSPGHKYDKSKTKVEKIEKIQNKTLCRQYLTKKKCLEESNPNRPANMPLERELWHGTNQNAKDSIILHGFNRSYAGDNAGKPWFGQGVYFAPDASYSARSWMTGADSAGSKGYVFLVKVLTGQFRKGTKNMRYLPPIDKKNPSVLYDCAVDKVKKPMEFVIFNDTQAYPDYILTFSGS
ncbi:protein mono-ADP-ribosyltransferase PARP14-like [Dreissena polymorpha]|uniref:Poly [ADP-ribose] polymerase n=1 Tax=Dreissena polymorpha TaxID=45954 RepID=A0A9D4F083_DREPO|nr:protein mono-ADP-ribosyltransferase PARP14-like [Dreissena polymorpha]KAH3790015.1 hypothetical protein DPMN_168209 [Dreissena polymorpha]